MGTAPRLSLQVPGHGHWPPRCMLGFWEGGQVLVCDPERAPHPGIAPLEGAEEMVTELWHVPRCRWPSHQNEAQPAPGSRWLWVVELFLEFAWRGPPLCNPTPTPISPQPCSPGVPSIWLPLCSVNWGCLGKFLTLALLRAQPLIPEGTLGMSLVRGLCLPGVNTRHR